jgi:hypothetical protein
MTGKESLDFPVYPRYTTLVFDEKELTMPNWCYNTLSVSHSDPAQIARFVKAANDGRLFEEFVPLNEEGEWDYNTAVNKWGTKWDIHESYFDSDSNSAYGSFDTAWSPPIEFYDTIVAQGFDVHALFHEPGMAFAGTYHTEIGDTFIDYDFSNPNWRDNLDEELVEWLEPEYESWLEWQEEMDEEE